LRNVFVLLELRIFRSHAEWISGCFCRVMRLELNMMQLDIPLTGMRTDVCLVVKDVSKRFGDRVAVDEVSFTVHRGEIYGLLGPNGAGKTTLLSMIAGILEPDSGEISIDGSDALDSRTRRKVGYCPQEAVVYNDLTGLENMMFYAGLHGLSGSDVKRRCRELLDQMGLGEYAGKKVKMYSGGMKKRLSFAITLIGDPELLLLDEPTTGMDPRIRRSVWESILRLKQEEKTIILATHYMEEADELSDRVAIMDLGRIVAEDSPESLKTRYGPKAVIDVEFSKPVEEPKPIVEEIKAYASEGGVIYRDGKLRVHVDNPDIVSPKIVSELVRIGAGLKTLKITMPTLEDVFLRLTGRRLTEE